MCVWVLGGANARIDRTEQRKVALAQAIFPTQDAFAGHKAFFRTTAEELIKDHTFMLSGVPGKRVDIVGNVINLVPVYWVSEFIVCSLCRLSGY